MYNYLLTIQYISVILLLTESVYIFVKWRTRLQGYLFFSCVVTLVNNACYLLGMTSTNLESYMIAVKCSYLGRVWIPAALFFFIMTLCKVKIPNKLKIFLIFFHGITFFLVATCEHQNLYYSTIEYVETGLFPHAVCGHGPWYIIYNGSMFIYIVVGITLLIRTLKKEKDKTSKKRLFTVLLAIISESLFFGIQMTGMTGAYDITVLGYTVATVIMYVALFKYDLLDTMELAREYVVDELTEGIIAVNNNGVVEYFNSPAKRLFPDLDVNSKNIILKIQDAINTDTPLMIDGRVYTPEISHLFSKGVERGVVYGLLDNTSHFEYLRELTEQKEIAESANASKSSFVSMVSHEIRTPMNAVVGMTDLILREKDRLSEKQLQYLQSIKTSGTALVMIVNDILDMSKLEAGKMELVEDDYELRSIVEDIRLLIENRIGEKNIKLVIDVDENIPRVLVGDGLRLRQIFINLLNNAVKFTEEGFIKLSFEMISKDDEAVRIRVAVADSGQGIREEDLKKLGDAFTQVDLKKNHSKEGTGLGLTISKNFIALMGGQLEVESEYGSGAEFFFTIDQKISKNQPEETNEEATSDEELDALQPTIKCQNAKALIVDDTAMNLMMEEELLTPIEIEIATSTSGARAIKMVDKFRYDIIFMDYRMPEMDGVETTKRIRGLAEKYRAQGDEDAAKYFEEVPIIALTGDTSDEAKAAFDEAKMNDFLDKPVDLRHLEEMLVKYLKEDMIIKL